jgi:hypothetical protein
MRIAMPLVLTVTPVVIGSVSVPPVSNIVMMANKTHARVVKFKTVKLMIVKVIKLTLLVAMAFVLMMNHPAADTRVSVTLVTTVLAARSQNAKRLIIAERRAINSVLLKVTFLQLVLKRSARTAVIARPDIYMMKRKVSALITMIARMTHVMTKRTTWSILVLTFRHQQTPEKEATKIGATLVTVLVVSLSMKPRENVTVAVKGAICTQKVVRKLGQFSFPMMTTTCTSKLMVSLGIKSQRWPLISTPTGLMVSQRREMACFILTPAV